MMTEENKSLQDAFDNEKAKRTSLTRQVEELHKIHQDRLSESRYVKSVSGGVGVVSRGGVSRGGVGRGGISRTSRVSRRSGVRDSRVSVESVCLSRQMSGVSRASIDDTLKNTVGELQDKLMESYDECTQVKNELSTKTTEMTRVCEEHKCLTNAITLENYELHELLITEKKRREELEESNIELEWRGRGLQERIAELTASAAVNRALLTKTQHALIAAESSKVFDVAATCWAVGIGTYY
eukprot:GHVR01159413.1.p1 GENE.GHVR01159413.1~~GHVR01159413.1.p1  ORF type:complete len:240 (-),score=72.53 GHVR01159413.1:85-804(-)